MDFNSQLINDFIKEEIYLVDTEEYFTDETIDSNETDYISRTDHLKALRDCENTIYDMVENYENQLKLKDESNRMLLEQLKKLREEVLSLKTVNTRENKVSIGMQTDEYIDPTSTSLIQYHTIGIEDYIEEEEYESIEIEDDNNLSENEQNNIDEIEEYSVEFDMSTEPEKSGNIANIDEQSSDITDYESMDGNATIKYESDSTCDSVEYIPSIIKPKNIESTLNDTENQTRAVTIQIQPDSSQCFICKKILSSKKVLKVSY